MSKFITWKNIYLSQLTICLLIGFYFIFNFDTPGSTTLHNDILYTIIIGIIFIGDFFRKRNLILNKAITALSIIFLPYVLGYFLTEIFYVFSDNTIGLSYFWFILYCLLYLFWFIPFTKIELAQIKQPYARLLTTIFLFLGIIALGDAYLGSNLARYLTKNALLYAVTFSFISYLLLKNWHLTGFNLKINKQLQIWALSLLIIFGIWFAFYQQFLSNADTWSQALWNWTNNFNQQTFSFSWNNLLNTLNVISEEIERYFTLTFFLILFKKLKSRVICSLLLSSLIFALMHYVYAINSNKLDSNTNLQVIAAFGVGCFLATIYLYTGKLWLSYLFHILIDFVAFSITAGSQLDLGFISRLNLGSSYNNLLLESILIALPPIIIMILMLFGQRRKVLEANAVRLIG